MFGSNKDKDSKENSLENEREYMFEIVNTSYDGDGTIDVVAKDSNNRLMHMSVDLSDDDDTVVKLTSNEKKYITMYGTFNEWSDLDTLDIKEVQVDQDTFKRI